MEISNNEFYTLNHKVQVEPLINNWYAWSYLMSPASASMIIAFSHLKIMENYLEAPHIHEYALTKPEMMGGPFIDIKTSAIDEIKNLIDKTKRECSHIIDFAHSIKQLSTLLNENAHGSSIEFYYKDIPEQLKGFVELFYDLNNRPGFRFIESLLYKSKYTLEPYQSISISYFDRGNRPFLFSTPRLIKEHDSINIKLPFNNTLYDKLFETKFIPKNFGDIKEIAEEIRKNCTDSFNESLFYSFFSKSHSSINYYNDIKENQIKISYFGHACLLIATERVNILIDPIINYQSTNEIKSLDYTNIPNCIDYLVITHAHQDHVLLEHLIQLRHKVKCVIVPKSNCGFLEDPSLKLFFLNFGFKNVIEIDDMEIISIPNGSITGIPFFGEHSDLNIQTKKAHLIELYGKKILCAADSNNLEPIVYKRVLEQTGTIDVLFLGMECVGAPLSWIYGPFLLTNITRSMDQSRRLDGSNFERGLELVKIIKPQQVYIYAMGQEPWLKYILGLEYTPQSKQIIDSDKLVQFCLNNSIISERLFRFKEIFL